VQNSDRGAGELIPSAISRSIVSQSNDIGLALEIIFSVLHQSINQSCSEQGLVQRLL